MSAKVIIFDAGMRTSYLTETKGAGVTNPGTTLRNGHLWLRLGPFET